MSIHVNLLFCLQPICVIHVNPSLPRSLTWSNLASISLNTFWVVTFAGHLLRYRATLPVHLDLLRMHCRTFLSLNSPPSGRPFMADLEAKDIVLTTLMSNWWCPVGSRFILDLINWPLYLTIFPLTLKFPSTNLSSLRTHIFFLWIWHHRLS
jgi:hypothetical protein